MFFSLVKRLHLDGSYIRSWLILAIDLAVSATATLVAFLGIDYFVRNSGFSLLHYLFLLVSAFFCSAVAFYIFRTYRTVIRHSSLREVWKLGAATLLKELLMLPHTMVLARRDDLQGDRPLRGAGSVRDGLYAHYGARADDSALRCDHPLAHPADEPYPHAGIRCRVEGGGARHAVAELAALRHVRIHHLRPPAQILRDRRTAGLLFRDGGEYRIRARQVRNRSHSFSATTPMRRPSQTA